MRRNNVELHLQVPKYSAETTLLQGGLRTPSIASASSYTRRPALARTMSTTSMVSSDGDGAMEHDWNPTEEATLMKIYEKELGTYSHNNPPFVPSAPPPALLGRVSKKAIRGTRGWPHSLAQTRKHLLLLVRRHAPEPSTPHISPQRPSTNTMSAITHDLPGFFSSARRPDSLNSPFDERTFNFDAATPKRGRSSPNPLLKQGSFGFGVPLTPSRKRREDLNLTTTPRRSSRIRSGSAKRSSSVTMD